MITFSKKSLVRGQAWFDEKVEPTGIDLLEQFACKAPQPGASCREFYTILVDLGQQPAALLEKIKPDARREIKRAAERDQLSFSRCKLAPDDTFERFANAYDALARQKGIACLDREIIAEIAEKTGALDVTEIKDQTGQTLLWHVYFRGSTRVAQRYNVSLFREHIDKTARQALGRANRYCTWQDMLTYQADGFEVFDLGGWYHGKTDEAKLRINLFKEEFGGTVVREYDCVRGITLKGKAFLWLRERFKSRAE